ncbi:phage tail protein [Novosphingobium aquae]|uniref:Phage tail protein n=1 Tax=Novosphingobium aquae TaxID=3133435 RepID=A0ABU8S4D4_9SPHN
MLKPDSLRARLTEAFPDAFARDATNLSMWVDQGHVRCHAGPDNLNFTVEYKLCVSITGWTLPSIMIWVTLIDWLRAQQPDLLSPANSAAAIPFEVDLVSADEVDLGFDLALTEPVRVTRREDGGFDMRVAAEPDPLFPDAAPLLPSGPLLKSIWAPGLNPVQIVPDEPEA